MRSLPRSAMLLLAPWLAVAPLSAEPAGRFAAPVTESQLRSLFARLGSDSYPVRESSQLQIQQLAAKQREFVLEKAVDAYMQAADPEIRYRLRSTMYSVVSADIRAEGFIGIRMMDAIPQRFFAPRANGAPPPAIQPEEKAVQILTVIAGTAGARAGLRPGDQILKLDGRGFEEDDEEAYLQLSKYIRSKRAGDRVVISLRRRGEEMEVDLELGARPEELDGDRKAEAFEEWMQTELLKRQGGPVVTD